MHPFWQKLSEVFRSMRSFRNYSNYKCPDVRYKQVKYRLSVRKVSHKPFNVLIEILELPWD